MPLGFERLNERVKRPNPHINFIKPLPGPSEATARDYLERIAAQCYPIMKSNYVFVMALEEYEPNPEFAGRNFNAGEVIQLVLKSRNGSWLPFRHVQMVMMHELAHCKQMNHSAAFWKVRNAYAAEMRELWLRSYTGEGLWGRGRALQSGDFMNSQIPDAAALPAHICGGTYRRTRRGKRKRGSAQVPQPSYAERKQRRILKKFGAGGTALGRDEDERVKLEAGKKTKGKPRVAGSARGRELRAAAALARFEKSKEEEMKKDETESDTDSEYDWPASDEDLISDAPNNTIIGSDGRGLIRICEDEDPNDENAKNEMQELLESSRNNAGRKAGPPTAGEQVVIDESTAAGEGGNGDVDGNIIVAVATASSRHSSAPMNGHNHGRRGASPTKAKDMAAETKGTPPLPERNGRLSPTSKPSPTELTSTAAVDSKTCTACSYANPPTSLICLVCSNVLEPAKMTNHWRCQSLACRDGPYANIGDYARCQVCGTARPVGSMA